VVDLRALAFAPTFHIARRARRRGGRCRFRGRVSRRCRPSTLPLPNRSCRQSDSPGRTRCPRPLLASAASEPVLLLGRCDPSELLSRPFVAVRRSGLTTVCKLQNRRSRGIFKFTGLSTTFLGYPPHFCDIHIDVHRQPTEMSTEWPSFLPLIR